MALSNGCPGARMFREVSPEYIDCPHCGREMEIWTDELVVRCPHCKRSVPRKAGASCLDWCAHAVECVGADKLRRLRGESK